MIIGDLMAMETTGLPGIYVAIYSMGLISYRAKIEMIIRKADRFSPG